MKAPTHQPAASRILDRLASARLCLEQRTQDGRHPAVAFATLVGTLLICGGLARLALDDTRVEVALPEPPMPTELAPAPQVANAALGLGSEGSPLLAQVRAR